LSDESTKIHLKSSYLLASDDLIETESVRHALVALFTSHSGWTDALAGLFLANSSRWAVAGFAVGETVVSRFASFALSPDDVGFA
jgi:hypothetical protein